MLRLTAYLKMADELERSPRIITCRGFRYSSRMRRCVFILLGCLLRLHAGQFDPIAESIRKQLTDSGAPSITVAVARDGKIIWEQGFGWADRARRLAAGEHTLYSIASISKPFTATGLMMLAQAGRVNLDSPVNDYLGPPSCARMWATPIRP